MTKMKKSQIYKEILAAVAANISCICFGLTLGWTSPIIPKLKDVLLMDTPLDRVITANEVGWIGSLVPIASCISPFLAGILAAKFGRKFVLLVSGANLGASFIILGFANSIGLIYLARLMQGATVGLTMTAMPMYIGEIAQDSLRGSLGTLMPVFMNLGILFSYCVGPFVGYKTFQFVCIIFPAIFIVLFVFMPESPTYYVMSGNRTAAINSLMFLRNTTKQNVTPEIELIERSLDQSLNEVKRSFTNLYKSRGNIRALIICIVLMWSQQFCGSNAVIYYAQSIFTRAGGNLEPHIATIVMGAVTTIVSCFAPYSIERFGRKTNLILSGVGLILGTSLLSIYFFLDEANVADSFTFLPIVSVMIFLPSLYAGFLPIPWAMLGELFPADVRTYATAIVSTLGALFATIVLLFFEPLNEAIGPQWVFTIFAICIVMGTVFVVFFVFETKGLSLLQIQERLNNVKVLSTL